MATENGWDEREIKTDLHLVKIIVFLFIFVFLDILMSSSRSLATITIIWIVFTDARNGELDLRGYSLRLRSDENLHLPMVRFLAIFP